MKIKSKRKEIKYSMIEKGVNQKEVSEKIGLTQSSFSNFLNGRSSISSKKAKILKEFLGKDFDYLFLID